MAKSSGAGIGVFLWKISVALYLIANGVLGLGKKGDFKIMFDRMFNNETAGTFAVIAGVIALVAGIAIILEMLNIKLSFLDTLILIIAIIWVVYIVIEIFAWLTKGNDGLWPTLQMLAVHLMVLASLLIASRKFG
jgi:ABC-type branched-subunit amino acid transport system permease subunit